MGLAARNPRTASNSTSGKGAGVGLRVPEHQSLPAHFASTPLDPHGRVVALELNVPSRQSEAFAFAKPADRGQQHRCSIPRLDGLEA
jgi:hypothetical protein